MPYAETVTNPHQQLDYQTVLANAFYSREELEGLPIEVRSSARDAVNIIKDQSTRAIRGEVAPQEVWTLSEQFLTGLQAAQEEKEVWSGRQDKETVSEALEASLVDEVVTSKNAVAYLRAVKLLAENSTTYTSVDGSMLVKNHDTLMNTTNLEAKELYLSMLKDPTILMRISNGYLDRQGKIDGDLIDQGYQFYIDIAKGFNMDNPEQCVKAWGLEPAKNTMRIAELEKDNPGAATLLHNFYGIRNFHRWPTQFLKVQFENHGNTEKPYGLSIAADDNRLGDLWREQAVMRDIQPEYQLRALEVGSPAELVRRMTTLDRLYGKERKISFALISAHGEAESIFLASSVAKLGRLSIQHNFTGVNKWFVENPLIVLASCSTGQERGIAQKLSRQIHATVVAPKEVTGIETIRAIKDGESLRLLPTFKHDENQTRIPVDAMLYINGELIRPDDTRYVDYFKVDTPISS